MPELSTFLLNIFFLILTLLSTSSCFLLHPRHGYHRGKRAHQRSPKIRTGLLNHLAFAYDSRSVGIRKYYHFFQFSILKSLILLKCFTLFVTRIRLCDRDVAATRISISSMMFPFLSNLLLISPKTSMIDLSISITGNSSAIL